MSDELKPCPFCGSPSVTTQARHPRISPYFVECSTCDAKGARREGHEAAIAAWNSRPIEDKLQARIDALEWLWDALETRVAKITGDIDYTRAGRIELDAILAAAREAVES